MKKIDFKSLHKVHTPKDLIQPDILYQVKKKCDLFLHGELYSGPIEIPTDYHAGGLIEDSFTHALGYNWTTTKGTFPKRLFKYIQGKYKPLVGYQDGITKEEILNFCCEMGNFVKNNAPRVDVYYVDFRPTWEHPAGYFADYPSCFLTSKQSAHQQMVNLDICVGRVWKDREPDWIEKQTYPQKLADNRYDNLQPVGRCFMIPTEWGYLVSNVYSFESSSPLVFARRIADALDTTYCKVSVSNQARGNDADFWVNRGDTWHVGDKEPPNGKIPAIKSLITDPVYYCQGCAQLKSDSTGFTSYHGGVIHRKCLKRCDKCQGMRSIFDFMPPEEVRRLKIDHLGTICEKCAGLYKICTKCHKCFEGIYLKSTAQHSLVCMDCMPEDIKKKEQEIEKELDKIKNQIFVKPLKPQVRVPAEGEIIFVNEVEPAPFMQMDPLPIDFYQEIQDAARIIREQRRRNEGEIVIERVDPPAR